MRGNVIVGEIGVMVTVLVLAALIAWVPDVRSVAASLLSSVLTARVMITQTDRVADRVADRTAQQLSRFPRGLAPEARELQAETHRMPSPSRVPVEELPEFTVTSDPPPEPRRTRKGRTP